MTTAPLPPTPPEATATAVLRELLATPAVKAWLQAGRPSRAATGAPGLVRTLFFGDIEVSLATVSELPELVNALFAALATLGEELERFPEPVLRVFLEHRLEAVDRATARRAGQVWLRLGRRLLEAGDLSLPRLLGARVAAPALGAWNQWLDAHPDGLERTADALLEAVRPEDLRRATERTATQLGAVLRRHPALAEALARLAAGLAWDALQHSLRAVRGRLRRGA